MEPTGDPTTPHNQPADGPAPPNALEQFIFAYSSSLLRYIQQILPTTLKSQPDPVDLYQTTVFEAFRRVKTFKHIGEGATVNWLKLLARRQIGMLIRADNRKKRGGAGSAESDPVSLAMGGLVKDFGLYIRTPSQSAMRTETMSAVETALMTLPTHLQLAVRLRYMEDLTLPEVASRLNKSERAAASLIFRGLRLLKRKLRHLDGQ